jgi:nitrate/TMAO reductase-like tetraheme cytochrome c subunit
MSCDSQKEIFHLEEGEMKFENRRGIIKRMCKRCNIGGQFFFNLLGVKD